VIAWDGPPPAAHVAKATAVGVGEREFDIAAYRTSVPAGTIAFSVTNLGQDPHDLAVRGALPRHTRLAATGVVAPAGHATLRLKLAPGRYELVCTLGDHAARGMRTTIVVRRAPKR
jgi:hypothetical protein